MQCTHQGGPLADGTLEGYEVECPLHGAKFDIRTGEVTNPPPSTPESAYAMIHLSVHVQALVCFLFQNIRPVNQDLIRKHMLFGIGYQKLSISYST